MKRFGSWGVSALAAVLLGACGGGGPEYSALVSFGDSLSDVGTYRVSTIAAVGGGKYNVNGAGGINWTERLAVTLGVAAPCAAQTGLNSIIPGIPAEAVQNHAGCTNYAQGGARITHPIGPQNLATYPAAADGALGQLTDPIVSQITRHLAAAGGRFSGRELVTVFGGGNDVFMNLAAVGAGAATPGEAVTAMGTAGAELAGYIRNLILANGATHVVVLNLPDVVQTPFGATLDAATQALLNQMVTAYNAQLATGLAGTGGVLLVDAHAQGQLQAANPAQYGISNATTPACDLAATLFASSLVCTESTLIAGDVSRYQFSDTVHPTPYGYRLIADHVATRLSASGWL